jgi:hypothetical protein
MNVLIDGVLLGLISWGGWELVKNIRQSRQAVEVSPAEAQINADFLNEQNASLLADSVVQGSAALAKHTIEAIIHASSHH